ncbi:MAG: universal stress protein [Variovorax sp.]|nr:universal stress protein [Variovorax sp.]
MHPHSILAVTDFSTLGDHALSRAAYLCAAHGAALKLLAIACPGEPPPPDAICRLTHHALQLCQRHGIRVRSSHRMALRVDDVVREAQHADLVLWGTAPAGNLRAFFMGQPVEALIRKARRPVLVVRREACEAYRRLRLASDAPSASRRVAEIALGLGGPDPVRLVHAIEEAELIVVGSRPASLLADRLLGSSAGRVLRGARTDVLVVPHDCQPASGATAIRRLAAEPPVRRVRAGAPQAPAAPNPAAWSA